MPFRWDFNEHRILATRLSRWLLLVAPVALATGASCALFLWALEQATLFREAHPVLLLGLPLAGVLIAWLYSGFGKGAEGGNNLLMDAIHSTEAVEQDNDSAVVPGRMAPLILVATVVTHLFGGSAGREGTAVQMGGSLAESWGTVLKVGPEDRRILLMAGIAAGFGGIFGTPLAGTVFALEVLTFGRIKYEALLPCLFAALIGDWTSVSLGAHHTHYSVAPVMADGTPFRLDWILAGKVMLGGAAFGLAATLFAELTHGIGGFFKAKSSNPLLRPLIGGVLVILLSLVAGADYLGLGVSSGVPGQVTIVSAFQAGGAHWDSWFWKTVFTAVTLGSGFKGGEVTPLFYIGATLGNALSRVVQAPVDLFAALGFVGVFAGATNTPLACTLMGMELFGSANAPYYALACFVAYAVSGHSGIYLSQRVGISKAPGLGEEGSSLRERRSGG